MTFHVRALQANDLLAVSELFDQYRQFYELPANQAKALNFLSERFRLGESVVLVATDSLGCIKGFCQMYPSFCSLQAAPIYTLYDLFVHPSARRTGVARQLLLAAEDQAQADGMVRLDLTTAKTNAQAQSVYASTGWIKDEIFLSYSRQINAPPSKP